MTRKRPAGDPQAAHRTNRCQHCETSWISCRALTRHRHAHCCPQCAHSKDSP